MRLSSFLLLGCLLMAAGAASARGSAEGAPDVLVLGDSQLTFGAAAAFIDELNSIAGSCGLEADATVGVIGVRSSTIVAWTGQSKSSKGAICNVDPKYKVNAGAYGTLSQGKSPYIQIGKGAQFQFCQADKSPLQAVFADGYYAPQLLIFFMLGNAADRWAASPEAAMDDVRAFMADLPKGQPCIFMTSAPTYKKDIVVLRQRAQENIAAAFAKSGSRCSFVSGLTEATVRENMGNAANFRRNSSGKVKDSLHPTEAAARRFLKLQRPALCQAISDQLGR